MSFNSNNDDYLIMSEGELSTILSNFDDDMIYDVVDDIMKNKFRDYNSNLSNLIFSLEQNFKQLKKTYNDHPDIDNKRNELYSQIIKQIIDYYDIQYNDDTDNNVDLYSPAFYLYSLCVSNFTNNIDSFLSNYIIREQQSLYNMINPEELKKMKDSSSVYSKKIYSEDNQMLAAIHAFLGNIVDNICTFDIGFSDYISNCYSDTNISNYINYIISENEDGAFFSNHVAPFIIKYRPIIITNTRLSLQQLFTNTPSHL